MVEDVLERARRVKILILDVDGVLTDGSMYYNEKGEVLKRFNTRDGMGISLLRQAGIRTAFVSGESTDIIRRRAEKLGVADVYLGVKDKLVAVDDVLGKYGLNYQDACFVGDDLNDYQVLEKVGLAIAVQGATQRVKSIVHHITSRDGGNGAVREVCDFILAAKGIDFPSKGNLLYEEGKQD